jgi:hypothetical protein
MNIIEQYKKRVIRIEGGSIVSDQIGGEITE